MRDQFISQILGAISPGQTFDNPGGGTSKIKSISERGIYYKRGSSTISITFDDMYAAYDHFKGGEVTSTELRTFLPAVFDSMARPAGHSCNCTFFFMVLQEAGLAGPLEGAGVRGNPYSVELI